MTPGMQCVLDVIRGRTSHRRIEPAEWKLAVALAGRHRVLPFFAHQLRQSNAPVPHEIKALLEQAEREAARYAFLQSSELKELLRAFASANLPVLPLKGPYLALRLYGRASLRISCDLDLLVHRADFPAAVLVLESLGFVAEARPDDYHQQFRRAATIVELHFDVENPLAIDFDIAGAWRHASLQHFGGQPAWQLAPHDELLYLCLHGVRHRFDRLSLVVDITRALQRLDLSHASLRNQVRDAGRFLLLGRAMARKLHPESPLIQLAPYADKLETAMEQLAARLWHDLLTTPATQQDWSSMHKFYLQTEPSTWRRIYRRALHLRILATRLIDADYRFAQRLGLTRSWQVSLLRYVRLATRRTT